MACDSQGAINGMRFDAQGPKWVRSGAWTVGVSGWWRTHDVLASAGDLAAAPDDPLALGREVRQLLLEDGYREDKEPGPVGYGGIELLALSAAGLWMLDDGFSPNDPWHVGEYAFSAVGCGRELAVGALDAWVHTGRLGIDDPHEACLLLTEEAVAVANRYSTGCGGKVRSVAFTPG